MQRVNPRDDWRQSRGNLRISQIREVQLPVHHDIVNFRVKGATHQTGRAIELDEHASIAGLDFRKALLR